MNEGQLPESQQHADEMHEEASEDESATDSLGNPDVSSDSPEVTSSTDDHTQAEHEHPTNEAANKAANEPANEVANEAANEGKDNWEHSQDHKLTNDNERTVQDSEPENNDPNNDPKIGDDMQETMEDNDEGVDDRTERTRVYTDPNGVQYDVRIEYSNPQDEESNDDVKVVGVAEQEQPHSGEDDPAGKVDDDKVESRLITRILESSTFQKLLVGLGVCPHGKPFIF